MDLQEHLDALKWGGNEGHGNGGEESRGGDLSDTEGRLRGGLGGEGADEVFADVVTLFGKKELSVSFNEEVSGSIGRRQTRLMRNYQPEHTQKLTATGMEHEHIIPMVWGQILHIGVTPTRGADTPAYSPYSLLSEPGFHHPSRLGGSSNTLASPSRATVLRTTSIAPV